MSITVLLVKEVHDLTELPLIQLGDLSAHLWVQAPLRVAQLAYLQMILDLLRWAGRR
jgi:hypothetical protein